MARRLTSSCCGRETLIQQERRTARQRRRACTAPCARRRGFRGLRGRLEQLNVCMSDQEVRIDGEKTMGRGIEVIC